MVARLSSSVALAGATTLLLFYLMKLLINSDSVSLAAEVIHFVDFVRVPEQVIVETIRDRVTAPEPPEEAPPLPNIAIAGGEPIALGAGPVSPETLDLGNAGTGLSDGPYLPLVKVQPEYPRSALARGLEGYVIVEFDVRRDGAVVNPRIVESSNSIFDRTSIEAATRFRYRPMVINGETVAVYGVQNRFSFEISE